MIQWTILVIQWTIKSQVPQSKSGTKSKYFRPLQLKRLSDQRYGSSFGPLPKAQCIHQLPDHETPHPWIMTIISIVFDISAGILAKTKKLVLAHLMNSPIERPIESTLRNNSWRTAPLRFGGDIPSIHSLGRVELKRVLNF